MASSKCSTPYLTIEGSIPINNLNDLFLDTIYALPFICSGADEFISTKVNDSKKLNKIPIYFQIPYIYSAADNIYYGKYTSTTIKEDNEIITTYIVPYKSELKEETVTITTIYNEISKILFFQIPREFSYNSKDEGSIAIYNSTDNNYKGKLLIPDSFLLYKEIKNKKKKNFKIDFDITSVSKIGNIKMQANNCQCKYASCSSACYCYGAQCVPEGYCCQSGGS